MTAVRPPIFPPSPAAAQPKRPDASRASGQQQFFEALLGKTAAPTAAAPAAAPEAPATRPNVERIPDPAAEPPPRILRPGSLLDIRV